MVLEVVREKPRPVILLLRVRPSCHFHLGYVPHQTSQVRPELYRGKSPRQRFIRFNECRQFYCQSSCAKMHNGVLRL